MQGIDNKFNVVYDNKYEPTPFYQGYGVFWRTSKFLVKQDNNYYSIKNNLSKLGQSKNDSQIEKWYENYGAWNIKMLMQYLNNKEIHMTKNEVTNIWQTEMKIDFNEITNSVELVEEYGENEANKIIKYSCDEYRIYDLLDDGFEVLQYIPNTNFLPREDVNAKLQIKGKRKNIFDRFNLQNPELLVYIDNKDVENALLEIEGIKQEDFKYQIKLDDEII
ncbi:MAG TPA: hypothetical protein DCL31_18245 [Clostridium sp.]|nr:hypothetical protein [Clostridium sp.]